MITSQTTQTNPNQTTQTSQLVLSIPTAIEKPSTWMRDGYSPTEIVLAIAILTSLTIGGIASVIVAIAGLVRTLVPQQQEDKSKIP
ncbi:hypothetical protein N0Y54_34570 [Nostoc punctiforme UO1]|uniref:hypothetical protein n=1 Tax=Nostoc punctiforme TaxID=272131 RepID=UPI0030AD405A